MMVYLHALRFRPAIVANVPHGMSEQKVSLAIVGKFAAFANPGAK